MNVKNICKVLNLLADSLCTRHLLNCTQIARTTQLSPRLFPVRAVRYSSTSSKFISSYQKDLFGYFKELQDKVSEDKSSWPANLLNLFGRNPRTALENFNVVLDRIQAFENALEGLTDVDQLIEDASSEPNETQRDELLVIAEDEKAGIVGDVARLNDEIVDILVGLSEANQEPPDEIALEVSAGVGGQEAMLFSAEIFDMYQSLCIRYGQDFHVVHLDQTDIGGYSKACARIAFTNPKISRMFLNESGVHRVQRVPSTDKFKRVHTSTVSVAVLPVFEEEEIEIPEKDLEIVAYCKTNSPGGQHANKVSTAIRIKHKPTGKIVDSSSSKSQLENRNSALSLLKARLSQEKINEQEDIIMKTRRQQVKNNERSDKIRTYNFHQDRITDHRIGFSCANVPQFLKGGRSLVDVMEKLVEKHDADELKLIIECILDERKVFLSSNTSS